MGHRIRFTFSFLTVFQGTAVLGFCDSSSSLRKFGGSWARECFPSPRMLLEFGVSLFTVSLWSSPPLRVCPAPRARRHHGSCLAERSAPGVTGNRSAWETEVPNGAGLARSPECSSWTRFARVRGRRSGSQGSRAPRTRVWPEQAPRGQGTDSASWRNAYCPLTWPPSASSPHSDAFPK